MNLLKTTPDWASANEDGRKGIFGSNVNVSKIYEPDSMTNLIPEVHADIRSFGNGTVEFSFP